METKSLKIREITLNGKYANIFFEGDDKQYGANLDFSPDFSGKKVGDIVEVTIKEVNGKFYVNMVKPKVGGGAAKFTPNHRKDAMGFATAIVAAGKAESTKLFTLADDILEWMKK